MLQYRYDRVPGGLYRPFLHGQVLIMNNAYVGNYGVMEVDVESDSVKIKGLIAKNISHRYSRMMAHDNLEDYLISNNIVAIYDVDTRALVQHIRSKGAMNCIISTELTDQAGLKAELAKVPDMDGLELQQRDQHQRSLYSWRPGAQIRIAVLDFGVKKHILNAWWNGVPM